MCSKNDINLAVAGAQKAQESWRNIPVSERMRVMLKYQELLKKNMEALAAVVAEENGKTFEDAKGDVFRGIEVVEHACSIPTLLMGEIVEGVARGVDTYSIRQPLGVCAGICPFNFPAMVPLWMFPLAVACGNAFVLKPSEQVPLTAMKLAELFLAARAPAGILQVVHGGKNKWTCCFRILTLNPFLLSVRRRWRAIFTKPDAKTENECRPWPALKTTWRSCPMPTKNKSSAL